VNSAQNDIHAAAEMICLIVEEMFEAELYKKRSQSQHENTRQDTAAMLTKRALLPYTKYKHVSYPTRINNKDEVLETTGAALDQAIRKIFTEDRLHNRATDGHKDFQKEEQKTKTEWQKMLEHLPYGNKTDEGGYLVYEQSDKSKPYICTIVECKIDEITEDKNYDKRRVEENRRRKEEEEWKYRGSRIEYQVAFSVN
jgi:hypothetical protein